jgi:sortase A
MRKKRISGEKLHKRNKWGVLIGIPLSLFVCGIILITIGTYNYMKYAFFLSGMLIDHDNSVKAETSSIAKNQKKIFPEFGEEFGELTIESASIDYPVINGDMEDQLLKGIGHFFGSRYPGENGKIVLDAHRNTLFKNLGKVKIGDKVAFKTNYGDYTYKVSNIRITTGSDKSIIEPADGSEKLVLYTCYPFHYIGNAPNRYVVTCDLTEGTPIKEILGGSSK